MSVEPCLQHSNTKSSPAPQQATKATMQLHNHYHNQTLTSSTRRTACRGRHAATHAVSPPLREHSKHHAWSVPAAADADQQSHPQQHQNWAQRLVAAGLAASVAVSALTVPPALAVATATLPAMAMQQMQQMEHQQQQQHSMTAARPGTAAAE